MWLDQLMPGAERGADGLEVVGVSVGEGVVGREPFDPGDALSREVGQVAANLRNLAQVGPFSSARISDETNREWSSTSEYTSS